MRKGLALLSLTLLAACAGGGGENSPAPGGGNSQQLPPPPVNAVVNTSQLISAEEDFVNGDQSWYTSGTASWSNHAGDTASAPNGSTAVDGSTCKNVSEGTQFPSGAFTQHVFVGIMYNGAEEALPQAIGMVNPQPPTTPAPPDYPSGHPNDNYPVELSQCRYNVHAHDYSGLVHIEDTSLPQSNTSFPAYANLQTLFDVWGAQLTSNGIAAGSSALSGRMIVYAGTPGGTNNGNELISSYTLFTGGPNALHFTRHMAIWVVIGSLPPQGLPEVQIVQTN